jgi:hypothetical protein
MVRPSVSLPHHNRLAGKPCVRYFLVYLAPSYSTPYDLVYRVGVPGPVSGVSNMGGLEITTAFTQPNLGALREAIKKTCKLAGDNFGASVTLPSINPPITRDMRG